MSSNILLSLSLEDREEDIRKCLLSRDSNFVQSDEGGVLMRCTGTKPSTP